jgi:hypothetical protein
MDLSGIQNEAEFFPAGTLSDALQDEIREITARWSTASSAENPLVRVTRATDPYLTALRQIRNTQDRPRRAELRRVATHALVTALGYDYHRITLPTAFEREPLVPLLARVASMARPSILLFLVLASSFLYRPSTPHRRTISLLENMMTNAPVPC